MNKIQIKLNGSLEKKIAPMMRGVGIDVEEVCRFRAQKPTVHPAFYQKIFTDREMAYCMSKQDPYPHFTARFAAKEAVAKAVGMTMYELNEIEIINNNTGHPKAASHSHPEYNIEISLSHTKDYGAAIALWLR